MGKRYPYRRHLEGGNRCAIFLRVLLLKHSFAGEDLTRRQRIVPPPGQLAVVRYTLDELDDLAGYVAP
jgi:hypothetical protein